MATIDLERRAEIGRLKREKTRAALIDSSLRVVAQFGFEAPTLDDFIAAAGVARGTFYNYFQTKESLFLAMAGHVADSVDAEILQLFKGIDDPAQRIAIAIRHFIRISKRNPDWGWVLVHTLPDTSGGWSEGMRRGVLADIRRGRKLGRFKIASVEAAVALGIGTLGAAIRATLVERTSASFPNAVAAMTLQGLGMVREEAEEIATMPLPEVDRQA
ncbi:Transcriptional regulator, TetR family [Caballeronia glathei]|jgi:AcrR family transcriptional regulator|uniref:Transcriptional regulator n=1 Tax=Caballeronia glathei TaxID=60547 RepID=A0A069PGF9_9BURK|nr:TetR/AcrR family transcriptional regulator [Caballeronia glathei]KDR38939.1 transcriptional regulator [Caballeronia glathei]CDY74818.1 Transcriptional regulator, TetR family [Caballeronia glathei]